VTFLLHIWCIVRRFALALFACESFANNSIVTCAVAALMVFLERNGTPFRGQKFKPWIIPAAKLLDFTAGTYVPGPSKLATFAIVIR